MNRWLALGLLLAVAGRADDSWVVPLDYAAPSGKPLQLHFLSRTNQLVAGFVTGYNSRPHRADLSGLRFDGTNVTGALAVTLLPDNYVPADGQPVALALNLDARAVAAPAVTNAAGRVQIRIPGAVRRLYQARGPNWKYALDMNLIFPLPATTARLETIVPDYRRYSAVVEQQDLQLTGHELTGVVTAVIDNGEQGTKGKIPREEKHTFTLRAQVIGATVAGTCEIRVGDLVATEPVLGSVNYEPPPVPARSIATLRLHKAGRNDGPILLQLSLSETNPIHGLAWVPAENHQPHTVDATGLKLVGDQLTGPVRVTVVPDVYRKGESFDVRCELTARVTGYEVSGTFASEDRGEKRAGTVTGELRAKTPPVVTNVREVAVCELDFGYALVSGAVPPQKEEVANHARVRLEFADGRLVNSALVNPKTGAALDATMEQAELRIANDWLTGHIEFQLRSAGARPGRYRYEFNATISGEKCSGYWRGTLDGQPILTKSSKLSGQLKKQTTLKETEHEFGIRRHPLVAGRPMDRP